MSNSHPVKLRPPSLERLQLIHAIDAQAKTVATSQDAAAMQVELHEALILQKEVAQKYEKLRREAAAAIEHYRVMERRTRVAAKQRDESVMQILQAQASSKSIQYELDSVVEMLRNSRGKEQLVLSRLRNLSAFAHRIEKERMVSLGSASRVKDVERHCEDLQASIDDLRSAIEKPFKYSLEVSTQEDVQPHARVLLEVRAAGVIRDAADTHCTQAGASLREVAAKAFRTSDTVVNLRRRSEELSVRGVKAAAVMANTTLHLNMSSLYYQKRFSETIAARDDVEKRTTAVRECSVELQNVNRRVSSARKILDEKTSTLKTNIARLNELDYERVPERERAFLFAILGVTIVVALPAGFSLFS